MAASLTEMLCRAASNSRAVAAFNVVDYSSMSAALRAAGELQSPVIIQISPRITKLWPPELARACFAFERDRLGADALLHLDHCRDDELARRCLAAGWDSVLFDSSELSFHEAVRQTAELVTAATAIGAEVEGEFEAIGPTSERALAPVELSAEFVARTGVSCLGPNVGTRHGCEVSDEELDLARIKSLAARVGVPLVLHGSTGLSDRAIRLAIQHGVAKVNVSTAIKSAYQTAMAQSCLDSDRFEPASALAAVQSTVFKVCQSYIELVGGCAA